MSMKETNYLKFRNNLRTVLGEIAQKENAEFYMLFRLLKTGTAEAQKERFYEVFGETQQINPDRMPKKKFLTWLDDCNVDLPQMISDLCEKTFAQELWQSKQVFDRMLSLKEGEM